MIQVEVAKLAVDAQNQPVLLLRPRLGDARRQRILPIWIGMQEATAILLAREGTAPPRPMSYDLMCTLLTTLDAAVQQVAVTRLERGTFYAEISLSTPKGEQIVDARPSDSIALAVRTGAPIFVADDVFDEASMGEEIIDDPEPDPADPDAEVAKFSHFLDTVDPEDFRS